MEFRVIRAEASVGGSACRGDVGGLRFFLGKIIQGGSFRLDGEG